MDNKIVDTNTDIAVGDRVLLIDRKMSGDVQQLPAEVMEVRYILGKITYVVETEGGRRKVVGVSQVVKAAE